MPREEFRTIGDRTPEHYMDSHQKVHLKLPSINPSRSLRSHDPVLNNPELTSTFQPRGREQIQASVCKLLFVKNQVAKISRDYLLSNNRNEERDKKKGKAVTISQHENQKFNIHAYSPRKSARNEGALHRLMERICKSTQLQTVQPRKDGSDSPLAKQISGFKEKEGEQTVIRQQTKNQKYGNEDYLLRRRQLGRVSYIPKEKSVIILKKSPVKVEAQEVFGFNMGRFEPWENTQDQQIAVYLQSTPE